MESQQVLAHQRQRSLILIQGPKESTECLAHLARHIAKMREDENTTKIRAPYFMPRADKKLLFEILADQGNAIIVSHPEVESNDWSTTDEMFEDIKNTFPEAIRLVLLSNPHPDYDINKTFHGMIRDDESVHLNLLRLIANVGPTRTAEQVLSLFQFIIGPR